MSIFQASALGSWVRREPNCSTRSRVKLHMSYNVHVYNQTQPVITNIYLEAPSIARLLHDIMNNAEVKAMFTDNASSHAKTVLGIHH